jgi:hypothetical protein
MSTTSTPAGAAQRQSERLTGLLDTVLPAPRSDRLVPVAETTRPLLKMVEDCLADVDITPVIQEIATTTGTSRFRVLVAAHDAVVAREAVAGR